MSKTTCGCPSISDLLKDGELNISGPLNAPHIRCDAPTDVLGSLPTQYEIISRDSTGSFAQVTFDRTNPRFLIEIRPADAKDETDYFTYDSEGNPASKDSLRQGFDKLLSSVNGKGRPLSNAERGFVSKLNSEYPRADIWRRMRLRIDEIKKVPGDHAAEKD